MCDASVLSWLRPGVSVVRCPAGSIVWASDEVSFVKSFLHWPVVLVVFPMHAPVLAFVQKCFLLAVFLAQFSLNTVHKKRPKTPSFHFIWQCFYYVRRHKCNQVHRSNSILKEFVNSIFSVS